MGLVTSGIDDDGQGDAFIDEADILFFSGRFAGPFGLFIVLSVMPISQAPRGETGS